MANHNIDMVFFCEMAEVHQRRPHLPAGWHAVGKGEFMIAHALGWQVGTVPLMRVWPSSARDHPTKGWSAYLQAAR